MNQKRKYFKGVGCIIFLVSLLCSSVARLEEVSLDNILDLALVEIDQETVQLLWVNCRTELTRLRDTIEDLNLCFPLKEPDSRNNIISYECLSFSRGNIREFLNTVHPEFKLNIIECLRKNSLPYRVSGDEVVPNRWYSEYLVSVSSKLNAHRRSLATSSPTGGTPEPHSPSHGRYTSPPSPPPKSLFFPPSTDAPSRITAVSKANSSSKNKKTSSKTKKHKADGDEQREILIAVITTAVVTFLLATLMFLCYTKVCRSRRRQNDERPLLSLSMNDYSTKSSYKPYGGYLNSQENPYENGFSKASAGGDPAGVGNNSLKVVLGWDENYESPRRADGDGQESVLKPPPGRTGSNPGLLKPPVGRADPLPPEPPAPPKPPMKAAPPPPPPPALKQAAATATAAPKPPGPAPPPPPARGGPKPGAPPPPPPKAGGPRPPPAPGGGPKMARPPPRGPNAPRSGAAAAENDDDDDDDAPKAKLKPFFWDKVSAEPDHSMVWHQIKSGSFQFNEEMIETLFGYAAPEKGKKENKKECSPQDNAPQFVQIIDPKKAQNLSILLKALNVTIEEVHDALREGNELPTEFLQALLKMAPTNDEELKLRLYNGEVAQLGPADRFIKSLVDIPFAFKRMEALLFINTLQEEVTSIKESFQTLEVACKELRNSRLFLKLLEAVLKTGNRMNTGTYRGGAQAFKLDTLLKLSDVKGTDGKTTLLHFVVQEIIRSEGVRSVRVARESSSFSSVKSDDFLEDVPNETEEYYRSLGLQVVSGLGGDLENVKKAAAVDADTLTGSVARLGNALLKARNFLNTDMKNLEEESGFHNTLKSFVQNAEKDVTWLLEEEKRITALVKSTVDYFHGNSGKDEGLRLFVIVRDFVIMLDKVCKEVKNAPLKPAKPQKREGPSLTPSVSDSQQVAAPDIRRRLFPAIQERRTSDSSSDDES